MITILRNGDDERNKVLSLSSDITGISVITNNQITINKPYYATYGAMKHAGFSVDVSTTDLDMSPLWLEITSVDSFHKGFKQSIRGMYRFRMQTAIFLADLCKNLLLLRYELMILKYRVGEYNLFIVQDKKRRIIRTPRYRDKIIQYIVNRVISSIYQPMFIYDSYSCIIGRGVQRAGLRMHYFLKKATHQYKEPTFIKMDISKFFASIDHNILFNILAKTIKCPNTLSLLYIIIESVEGPGLPLGNMISQTMANIYMNEFDQYVKHQLKIKYYIRYADDMFFIVDGKEYARELAAHMTEWLHKHLKLTVNPKKTHISTKLEIPCLGYIIRYKNIKLQSKNMQKVKKAIASDNSKLLMSYRGLWDIANVDRLILYYTSKTPECIGKVQDVVERIWKERKWEKKKEL